MTFPRPYTNVAWAQKSIYSNLISVPNYKISPDTVRCLDSMKTGVMANRHIKLVIPVLNYTNYDKDTIKKYFKATYTTRGSLS